MTSKRLPHQNKIFYKKWGEDMRKTAKTIMGYSFMYSKIYVEGWAIGKGLS